MGGDRKMQILENDTLDTEAGQVKYKPKGTLSMFCLGGRGGGEAGA